MTSTPASANIWTVGLVTKPAPRSKALCAEWPNLDWIVVIKDDMSD